MPSNEQLSNRAHELVADVQSLTQSAKQHIDEYRVLSNEAYASIQTFLKSKGVTTVDEWLEICQKELSPEEAASVQKTLADLEPAHGLSALVQPSEIAKFIAGWFIVKGGLPLFQAAALNAKAWYYREIEVSSVASTTEELTEAAEFLESDEVPVLVAAADAEVSEVVIAEAAAAAEVTAVATAEAVSAWNLVFLGVGAVLLAATIAYSKHKEKQDAAELKEMVAKLATARLYAFVGEKAIIAQTDQRSILSMLNDALEEGDVKAQEFFKKEVLDGIPAIDVKVCYEQLRQQDASKHAMTAADPHLEDMVQRHAKEVQAVQEKAKGAAR